VDLNVVAFCTVVGIVLVGGLYAYGALGVPANTINTCFGVAFFGCAVISILLTRSHIVLSQPVHAVFSEIQACGFLGLIVDGVIFKCWKPMRVRGV
jgi:hypothetical protein